MVASARLEADLDDAAALLDGLDGAASGEAKPGEVDDDVDVASASSVIGNGARVAEPCRGTRF